MSTRGRTARSASAAAGRSGALARQAAPRAALQRPALAFVAWGRGALALCPYWLGCPCICVGKLRRLCEGVKGRALGGGQRCVCRLKTAQLSCMVEKRGALA